MLKSFRIPRPSEWIPETIYSRLKLIKMVWFPHPYEPEVSGIIHRIVKPGWICADVGANRGIITRILAKQVGPLGRVIAFEAFYKNAKFLCKFIKVCGYASRVKVENIAISDGTQSEICLFPGRASSNEEWNIIGHDLDGKAMEAVFRVPATSLDNYFPPGSVLNFVKIDIEGAESLALRGMRRILRESRPVVLVEFHDEAGWRGREELFAASYNLHDMKGRQLDPNKDVQRVYHCLACPMEKNFYITYQFKTGTFNIDEA